MKIKPILFLLLIFSIPAFSAEIPTSLNDQQLITMQDTGHPLVIDVRTHKEWNETGSIPGSQILPFFSATGEYNVQQWLANLEKLKSSPDQPVILVCRSGRRSNLVGNILTKQFKMKNIYQLDGGINGWLKNGHHLDKTCLNQQVCQ